MSSFLRLSSSAVTLGKRDQGTEGVLSEKAESSRPKEKSSSAKISVIRYLFIALSFIPFFCA
jgi:hypothetical protein